MPPIWTVSLDADLVEIFNRGPANRTEAILLQILREVRKEQPTPAEQPAETPVATATGATK